MRDAVKPYYQHGGITIYHADCREVGDVRGDVIITDPPYGETQLAWDSWPEGWPSSARLVAPALWCFGSMRMFLDRKEEFCWWQFGQDVVWEKQDGSGFSTDRFRRVHEYVVQWYRGPWGALQHEVPRLGTRGPDKSVRRRALAKNHHGVRGESQYVDDGTRLMRSVIAVPNCHGRALHPTEKPAGIISPLIEYSCPSGGVVVDLFAGSGSTLRAAKDLGRKAVGIEVNEAYCEVAANRLSQEVLFGESIA